MTPAKPPSDEELCIRFFSALCLSVDPSRIRDLKNLLAQVRAEANQEKDAEIERLKAWLTEEAYGASLPENPIDAILLIANERAVQHERTLKRAEAAEAERDALRERVRALEEVLRECRICSRHAILCEPAPEKPPAPDLVGEASWLVWSNEHAAWWASNRCGYTTDVVKAGRYTLPEALRCEDMRSVVAGKNPPEMIRPSPELLAVLLAPRRDLVGELVEALVHERWCRTCAEDGCLQCGDCTAEALLAIATQPAPEKEGK